MVGDADFIDDEKESAAEGKGMYFLSAGNLINP
jgi:hypothetical protein